MNVLFLLAQLAVAQVANQPAPALPPAKVVEHHIHQTALVCYGFISMATFALVVWVKWSSGRRIPKCLTVAAVGMLLWLGGAIGDSVAVTLLGVMCMSSAHVIEATYHLRQKLKRVLRPKH